jgi:hypothetical protein
MQPTTSWAASGVGAPGASCSGRQRVPGLGQDTHWVRTLCAKALGIDEDVPSPRMTTCFGFARLTVEIVGDLL